MVLAQVTKIMAKMIHSLLVGCSISLCVVCFFVLFVFVVVCCVCLGGGGGGGGRDLLK